MSGSRQIAEAEIVVVGSGPAGIAAAVRANESGARVVVLDDNPGPGGQIWRGGERSASGRLSGQWLRRFRTSGVRVLSSAQVISADAAARTLLVETDEETLEFRFEKLILATGAREIFLPFPGWTLPGVMGVGGLQALAKSGLPVAGTRIIVAGSGPLLLAVAAYLHKHGARVKLIAEQASAIRLARFTAQLVRDPAKIIQAAGLRLATARVRYLAGSWVEAAEGHGRVERVRMRRGRKVWMEDCDYAAVAYGLYPNTELAALLGCRMSGQAIAVNEFGESSVEAVFGAGECTGIGGVDLSIIEGEIAGYAACGDKERAKALFGKRERARRFAHSLNRSFNLRGELKAISHPETLVCRCEDVPLRTLREFSSFRAAKLHTRCGMGPCQGRVCGPAMEYLFGWKTESIRPPIFPARVGSLIRGESVEKAGITE